jgi:hypothetical protein
MSVVSVIGAGLIVAGGVAFFIHRQQKHRSFSLKSARSTKISDLYQTATAIATEIGGGNWRDYVRVWGKIEAEQPLRSQIKQCPCVYYISTVVREYEEIVTRKDSEGNETKETQRGSETISRDKQSIPFQLRDDSGTITVDPTDGDMETLKVVDEFRTGHDPSGLLSFGGLSLTLGSGRAGRRTLGYRYTESVLPVDREALVVGMVSDSTGNLAIRKPVDLDRRFILSLKTYEELTKAADRNASTAYFLAIAGVSIGVLLFIIGLIA